MKITRKLIKRGWINVNRALFTYFLRIPNFLQRILHLILKSVFNCLKMKLGNELVGPLGDNSKSSAVSKNLTQIKGY